LWHRAIRGDANARVAEALISVDTFQAAVARAAVEAGADMVNDVSGGLLDPAMHSTVSYPQEQQKQPSSLFTLITVHPA
jgi:dihydropteroate synthase